MVWRVVWKESVIKDLRWMGSREGRLLLREAEQILTCDPTAKTRNLKTLRPNPFAQRELRLFGRYRIRFNLVPEERTVTVLLAGEKRGNLLLVQGVEFRRHHENHPLE